MLVSSLSETEFVRNTMFRVCIENKKHLAAASLIAVGLSACSADQAALESKYHPYGGSDRHPIHVTNGKAHVKPCGDWTEDAGANSTNEQMPNLGCAVQTNIAAMVAKPKHIIKPHPMGPATAASRIPGAEAMAEDASNRDVSSAGDTTGGESSGGGGSGGGGGGDGGSAE
jgi:type IV pilus biogenesis protein CpaD/CtpE